MNDYLDLLKKQIDDLYHRIHKERDSIIAYNMLEKGHAAYQSIFMFPYIINKNLQCGNYKRALRYYMVADALMSDIEENKVNIMKKITDYIVTD